MIRGLRRLSLLVPCYAKQPLVQVKYSMTWADRAWDLHKGPWDPWAHDGAVASLPSSKRRGTEMQGGLCTLSWHLAHPGLCRRDTCPLAMDVLSSRTMGTRRIDGPHRVHREPLALLTHLHNPFGTEAGLLRLFPSRDLASKLLPIIGQFQAWVLKLAFFSLLWLHGDYAELKGTLWVALGMPSRRAKARKGQSSDYRRVLLGRQWGVGPAVQVSCHGNAPLHLPGSSSQCCPSHPEMLTSMDTSSVSLCQTYHPLPQPLYHVLS